MKKSISKLTDADIEDMLASYYNIKRDDDEPTQKNIMYKLKDDESFPISNWILAKTGCIPNKVFSLSPNMSEFNAKAVIEFLKSAGFKLIFDGKNFEATSDSKYEDDKSAGPIFYKMVFEKSTEDGYTIAYVFGSGNKNGIFDVQRSMGFQSAVYSVDNSDIHAEVEKCLAENIKFKKFEQNNIHLVISTGNGGYDTTEFELPKSKIDIEMNYGRGFVPVHKKILETLNKKNGKGLVLLHGLPGTGKTHYLKHLASKIKGKRVLFIPPYLVDFITSPEITPFLIDNSNSVLFIEDAERVITDRNVGGGNGVSNMLNLTDGILSDILNIQIVATFNMDKSKIDTALLRKGRLIAEHKFDALPQDESQRLIDHLGFKAKAAGPMTLTEIYNVNEVEYKSEERQRIGFGY